MGGSHSNSIRQIALLAGEDLDGGEEATARRHLDECPKCRRHWVKVRGCLDVLERVAVEEAKPYRSLRPAVEARLRPNAMPWREKRYNGWTPALSLAAACITLMAVGQVGLALRPDPASTWPSFVGYSSSVEPGVVPVQFDQFRPYQPAETADLWVTPWRQRTNASVGSSVPLDWPTERPFR